MESNISNDKTNNTKNQSPIMENNRSVNKVVAPYCFLPDSSDKKTVGINGFGRIGKLIYSLCIKRGIPVVQINDPNTTVDDVVYSMTYDTAFGKMLNASKCKVDSNYINGKYESCNCPINKNSMNIRSSKNLCPCPLENLNTNCPMKQQSEKVEADCPCKQEITCPNKCAGTEHCERKNCPFLKNMMCPCNENCSKCSCNHHDKELECEREVCTNNCSDEKPCMPSNCPFLKKIMCPCKLKDLDTICKEASCPNKCSGKSPCGLENCPFLKKMLCTCNQKCMNCSCSTLNNNHKCNKTTCIDKNADNGKCKFQNCLFLRNIMCPYANSENPRCIKRYTETHIVFRTLITNERDPSKINWKCDLLIEASGIFKTHDLISKHTVDMAIVTAPSIDLPMFVYGVNHMNYLKEKPKYISNASCTTNCLAPIIKLLDDNFGIVKGTMSTIHSVTASQSVVDKSSRFRRNRSILNNIIPTTTGATGAVIKVFPHLKDRLTGMAFRVPTLDVSCIDLTVFLKDECTKENLIELIEQGDRDILDYTVDEVVSSDFIGDPRSCILDVNASILNGRWIKLVCWYDNEYGYAQRVIDLMTFVLQNNQSINNFKEEEVNNGDN